MYWFPSSTVVDVVDVFAGPPSVRVYEAGHTTSSHTVTSSILCYRYFAVSSRLAGGVGILSGTGLVPPT